MSRGQVEMNWETMRREKVSELKLCFKKNMKCKKEIMPNSQSQEDRWK